MDNMTKIEIGGRYPLQLHGNEGASAQLLIKDGGFIQIALPGMTNAEEKALRYGTMRAGVFVQQPFIALILKFQRKRTDPVILECPFDSRPIPDHAREFPNINNSHERLAVDLHIIDSETMIVRGLRFVTLAPGTTRDFLSAVQDQLSYHRDGTIPMYNKVNTATVEELCNRVEMLRCG